MSFVEISPQINPTGELLYSDGYGRVGEVAEVPRDFLFQPAGMLVTHTQSYAARGKLKAKQLYKQKCKRVLKANANQVIKEGLISFCIFRHRASFRMAKS